MTARTAASSKPRASSCSATMRSRASSKSIGVMLRPRELQRAERIERLVVREIEMDRRDGDEALAHRVEVRALGVLELELLAADPVVLLAARIDLLGDRVAVPEEAHGGLGEPARRPDVHQDGDGEV